MKPIFLILFSLFSIRADAVMNGKVVSGAEGFAKSVVGLAVQNGEGGYHIFCTASLINSNSIVTAAHCIDNRDARDKLFVVFGLSEKAKDLQVRAVVTSKNGEENENFIAVFKNDDIDIHDIAVAQFEGLGGKNILPSGFVPFSILSESQSDQALKEREEVTLAGYGFSSFDLSGLPINSGTLNFTTVPIADSHSAKTEVVTDEGRSGTCAIDSGGPAMIEISEQYYLWGITSRGSPQCLGGTGVYTKISSYEAWIKTKLQLWTGATYLTNIK